MKTSLALSSLFTAFFMAASAAPVVYDLNGKTRALGGNGLNKLAEEYGNEVIVKNGALTVTYADANSQFGYVGIGEGATLTVSDAWQQSTTNGELAVLTGGTVNFNGSDTKFAFRKGVNKLTIDGGTVNVTKYLGPGNSAFSSDNQDVCSIVTMNAGKLNVGTHIYLGYANPKTKSSKTYYTAKSYSSEFYLNGGKVVVGGTFYIGNSHQTDRVTGSPDQMLAVLGPGEVTFNRMAIYKGTPSTNVRFNGATLHTGSSPSDPWIGTVDNVEYGNYAMDEGGVTLDVVKDAKIARPINQGTHEGGIYGALVKTGSGKLTIAFEQRFLGPVVCRAGTIVVTQPLASKSIEARGGVIDMTSGSLTSPVEDVAIVMTDGGSILGLDPRQPFKSIALVGGIAVDMVFGAENCETPFAAASVDLSGVSSENPIVLNGSFAEGVHGLDADKVYTVIPASESMPLKPGDETKFIVSGISAELKVENGALVAVPGARSNGRVVWNGGEAGGNWGDDGMWRYQDDQGERLVNFLDGDTAVFAKGGDQVVVDGEMKPLGIIAEADVGINPLGEIETAPRLVVPVVEVAEGATAEIYAPFANTIEKTGKGTLMLGPVNDQAVVLSDGRLTFNLPGPTVKDMLPRDGENAIGAILDLAGAEMTLAGSLVGNGEGVLRDGGSVTNGTLKIEPLAVGWWRMKNTTFTVRKDATLIINRKTDQGGEIGFNGGAKLIIDGGRVEALNQRSTGGTGGYLGCDEADTNMIRIENGGYFHQPNQFLRVGFNGGATGILSVDGGTVDVAGYELRIAADGAHGILALTNGVLKAHALRVAESAKDGNLAQITMKDTTAYLGRLYSSSATAEGSFALFDHATIVPTGSSDAEKARFFDDLRLPITLAGGGLTISNAYDVGIKQTFAGPGALVKQGPATLTLSSKQSFTGGLRVEAGALALAAGVEFVGKPTLTIADGATVAITLTEEGLAGSPGLKIAVDPATSGKAKIVLNAEVLPEEGRNYTLFAGGINAEELATRLELPEGFGYSISDSGVITMRVNRRTQEWTGGGETNCWSEAENWSATSVPRTGDELRFVNADGGETVYDLADCELLSLGFEVGAWTVDLGGAAFNTWALTVAETASLTLRNAPENPLPFASGLVELHGVVDFGGATQAIDALSTDDWSVRNGRLVVTSASDQALNATLGLENAALNLGERKLVLGSVDKANSTLVAVNSSLTAGTIVLGDAKVSKSGTQTAEFLGTTLTLSGFVAGNLGSNSSIVFDGATLVDRNGTGPFLRELGIPYTLGEGGLTFRVGDRTQDQTEITVPGRFTGVGNVVLEAQGVSPKEIRFSGDIPDKGLRGRLIVKSPLYFKAYNKNFDGALEVKSGVKVDFGESGAVTTFGEMVMIEEGVTFVRIEPGKVYEEPIELVASETGFESPLLGQTDEATGNAYFIRSQGDRKVLCYGCVPPTMFIIH